METNLGCTNEQVTTVGNGGGGGGHLTGDLWDTVQSATQLSHQTNEGTKG